MIHRDDLSDLLSSWFGIRQWFFGHTSFMKPIHRYRGEIVWVNDSLVFQGWDLKERTDYQEIVRLSDITQVSIDFDRHFRQSMDRQLGIAGFRPLSVCYRVDDGDQIAYIFARFGYLWWGARTARDNQDWHDFLLNRLEETV